MLADLALVVLFLSLAAGLFVIPASLALGHRDRAGRAGRLLALVVALYAAALFGTAFASRERVLAPGEEKSVSGFDPHLHFRVEGGIVRGARGDVAVTVLLRSDARRAVQDPSSLIAVLEDGRGRRWTPVVDGAGSAARGLFARRLWPGESYTTTLSFRPDPAATGLRLLVGEAGWPCRLTIGHEASPFHRQTWFALGDGAAAR